MKNNRLDENFISKETNTHKFIPYLLTDTTSELPINIELGPDYYYASFNDLLDFNDVATRLKFNENHDIPAMDVLMVREDLIETVNEAINTNIFLFKYFKDETIKYLITFNSKDLIASLASKKMNGVVLELAKDILEKNGINSVNELVEKKKSAVANALAEKKKNSRVRVFYGCTIFTLVVFFVLLSLFLYVFSDFPNGMLN